MSNSVSIKNLTRASWTDSQLDSFRKLTSTRGEPELDNELSVTVVVAVTHGELFCYVFLPTKKKFSFPCSIDNEKCVQVTTI